MVVGLLFFISLLGFTLTGWKPVVVGVGGGVIWAVEVMKQKIKKVNMLILMNNELFKLFAKVLLAFRPFAMCLKMMRFFLLLKKVKLSV